RLSSDPATWRQPRAVGAPPHGWRDLSRRGVRRRSVDRAPLLKRLDQAWQAFQESHAGLSEAELLVPGGTGTWSVKDIIAHVTWWEEEALTHLPLILAGGTPPRYSVTHGGIDAFNAKMEEEREDLPPGEGLRRPEQLRRPLVS